MPAQAVACTKCQAIVVSPTGPNHSAHMFEPLNVSPCEYGKHRRNVWKGQPITNSVITKEVM